MQTITPFLWFDTQAEEAMRFYVSVFKKSKTIGISHYSEGAPAPAGSVMTATFELEDLTFTALNGGPVHAGFTQAISFFVNCDSAEEVNELWAKLSESGTVMMELDEYPFSKRYGWTQDKFGVSWQIILRPTAEIAQKIVPCLLFVGKKYGKAEEAIKLYTSVFPKASISMMQKAGKGGPEPEGAVQFSLIKLFDQTFALMEGMGNHKFDFTPATSFLVSCETQEEVDTYWNALTRDGGQEVQCGWLTDKFGVSWQIIPKALMAFISDPDPIKAGRAMQAMMTMKKIEIAELQKAYDG